MRKAQDLLAFAFGIICTGAFWSVSHAFGKNSVDAQIDALAAMMGILVSVGLMLWFRASSVEEKIDLERELHTDAFLKESIKSIVRDYRKLQLEFKRNQKMCAHGRHVITEVTKVMAKLSAGVIVISDFVERMRLLREEAGQTSVALMAISYVRAGFYLSDEGQEYLAINYALARRRIKVSRIFVVDGDIWENLLKMANDDRVVTRRASIACLGEMGKIINLQIENKISVYFASMDRFNQVQRRDGLTNLFISDSRVASWNSDTPGGFGRHSRSDAFIAKRAFFSYDPVLISKLTGNFESLLVGSLSYLPNS